MNCYNSITYMILTMNKEWYKWSAMICSLHQGGIKIQQELTPNSWCQLWQQGKDSDNKEQMGYPMDL